MFRRAARIHQGLIIQGIHKRMLRFQKLTRNLFLTLHGHNVHRQQRQLSQVSHALITVFQCVHPGSHDTHSHGNQIHPRLGVACPL
jgi:hypothetical protein